MLGPLFPTFVLLLGLTAVQGNHQNFPSEFRELLLNDLAQTPAILSCFYGYAGCIGVPNGEGVAELQQRGCSVVGNQSASPSAAVSAQMCGMTHHSIQGASLPQPMDGMPCMFSFPVDMTSLTNMSQFEIELANGTVIHPDCVTNLPANEMAMLHTLLLQGDFGAKSSGTYPVKVRVLNVRPLVPVSITLGSTYGPYTLEFTGNDMTYASSTTELVRARLMPATMMQALDGAGVSMNTMQQAMMQQAGISTGASTCLNDFPQATHSMQVMFSGGSTKDGVNGMASTEATTFFEVKIANSIVDAAVLGLSDINNDNYFEVCLNLTSSQVHALQSGGMTVKTPCAAASNSDLYGPKGKCTEANSACTATPCRVKTLNVDLTLVTGSFVAESSSTAPPETTSSAIGPALPPSMLTVCIGLVLAILTV